MRLTTLIFTLLFLTQAKAACPKAYGYGNNGYYGGVKKRQIGKVGECLMPGSSTLIKPPAEADGLYPRFKNGAWELDLDPRLNMCAVVSDRVRCGIGFSFYNTTCVAPKDPSGKWVKNMELIIVSGNTCTYNIAKKNEFDQKQARIAARINNLKTKYDSLCPTASAPKDQVLCALAKDLMIRHGKETE